MVSFRLAGFVFTLVILDIMNAPTGFAQENPQDTGIHCRTADYDFPRYNNGQECLPCPPRTILDKNNPFRCLPCPAGHITEFGRAKCLKTCPVGFAITDNQECAICSFYMFSAKPNSRKCEECPKGEFTQKYAGKDSLGKCIGCASYQAPIRDGDDHHCGQCPYGQTSGPGEGIRLRQCVACPEGTSREDREDCKPCPIGTFAEYHEFFDYSQVRGSTGDYGHRICKICPLGMFSNVSGRDTCDECPLGSVSSADRTSCIADCALGNPGCDPCPPGTEPYSSGKGGCRKCAPGTVNPFYSMTPCVPCTDSRVPNAKQDMCICTGDNAWHPPRKSCRRCKDGATAKIGECICPNGKVYKNFRCVCKPGEKQVREKCVPCGIAEILTSASKCSKCDREEFFNMATRTCLPCPAGTVQDRPSLSSTCQACNTTHKNQFGLLKCGCPPGSRWVLDKFVKCPVGTALRVSQCIPCGLRFYSDEEGLSNCKECPVGARYSEKKMQTQCPKPCATNEILINRECACALGYEDVGTAEKTECQKCPEGMWTPQKGGKCVCRACGAHRIGSKCVQRKCPLGTVFTYRGCRTCGPNHIPSESQCLCLRCPERSFALISGSTKCVSCPKNQFITKKHTCDQCPTGYRVRKHKCVKCWANHVSNGGSIGYCTRCRGNTAPNEDNSKCVEKVAK